MPAFFMLNRFGRCVIKELTINEEIRAKSVRLIDDDGEQVGILTIEDALAMAEEKSVDLVLMAPNAKPPVAKLMDYGKYRYDTLKKQKEQRKKQKMKETREMRFSPRIDSHDLETKSNKIREILEDGDDVKVTVRFRGREMGHTIQGEKVLEELVALLGDVCVVDKKPKMEGRNMVMVLNPNPDNQGGNDGEED